MDKLITLPLLQQYNELITDKLKTTYALKSELPNMSNYALKSDVTSQIASKQDKLVSGTNIKTINGQTLLGEGDVDMSGFALKTDLNDYVTLNGAQAITGRKTFSTIDIEGSDGSYYAYTNIDEEGIRIHDRGYLYQVILSVQSLSDDGMNLNEGACIQLVDDGTYFSRISPKGVTISNKTSSDLLHAAGGTTTLKTINGESLLGSGDITTPTPTVNAASGTKTIWTGTQSEYEAVTSKDADTLYFITEE